MAFVRKLLLIALSAFLFVVAVGWFVGKVVQLLGGFIRAEIRDEGFEPVESVLALAAQSKYRIALFLLAVIGIGCVFTWVSRWWGQRRRRKAAVERYGAVAKLPSVCLSDAPLDEDDEDFDDYEEGFDFGDEDTTVYEVECACGNVIDFDEEVLESGSIICPDCGETLEFSFEDEDEE